MRVFLSTLGCRLNEAELAGWRRAFRAAGHQVVASPEAAQLMVVNSCAVTATAARKSRKLVAGLHRRNPAAKLVLTGCYAELEPAAAAALAGVDLVIGNRDKDRLVDRVEAEIDPATMPALAAEPDADHVYADPGRTRAFVKVQDGCRNRCGYCVVTLARGEERSRPIDEVVDEVDALIATGYREVVLTGVHLGGFGSDHGADLTALVGALLARTEVPRLRLSSLEPWDLPADFFALWRDPRLMPHLHLPLQSGSDRVLRRMSRRSSTASYLELVDTARAAIPDLTLTTDIIVGYPGEDQAAWAETLAMARRIGFAHLHIFAFSARPGTRAASLPDRVPAEVIRDRSAELHALGLESARHHRLGFVGQTREVLWETSRAAGSDRRRWLGYTDNYLRVATETPDDLANRITPTRLTALDPDDDELMRGDPIG